MNQPEFDTVTALALVRSIKADLSELEAFTVPGLPPDQITAARVTARKWEADIMAQISIRKERKNGGNGG